MATTGADRDRIHRLLDDSGVTGRLAELSPEEQQAAAADLARLLPRRLDAPGWGEIVGPCYPWQAAATILGVSTRQAVDHRRRSHQILGVRTSDRRWIYPAFQWTYSDTTGWQTLPGLDEILEILQPERHDDGLHAAWWLLTPNRILDGDTPAEQLRRGDVDAVVPAARAEADDLHPRRRP